MTDRLEPTGIDPTENAAAAPDAPVTEADTAADALSESGKKSQRPRSLSRALPPRNKAHEADADAPAEEKHMPAYESAEDAGENAIDPDVYGEAPPDAPEELLPEEALPEEVFPEEVLPEEPAVEGFLPTAYFQKGDVPGKKKKKKKKRRRRKDRRAILVIVIGLLIILGVLGASWALRLVKDPGSFFEKSDPTATPTPNVSSSVQENTPEPSNAPNASPTLDPYTALAEQADLSMMQNIVNVLVIGVDYAEERETWGGKHDYHSDVMMIIAINFDANRVDLISLPRDTYAKIPGVSGIYKLNASINCGGGFEAEGGAGFLKTCEAASWMLGGIPVDYYYAVTMPAVKQLVDAFGGVDYDLELSFTMAGRSYSKGPQHMNGQAVLDYLRVRKNVAKSGDQNRVNRQKQMMVALFKQMQKKNLLLKIPDILSTFNGQLFTNCTAEQTAALALFAYNLSSESIGMHSMGGAMTEGIFNWNFVLTDQGNRVEIIQDVYGLDVPKYYEYSATYAHYRWQSMIMDQYMKTTKSMTREVKDAIAADNLLPTASPSPTPEATLSPTPSPTPDAQSTPTATPTTAPTAAPPPTTEPTAAPPDPTTAPTTDPASNPTGLSTGGDAASGMYYELPFGFIIPVESQTQQYNDAQRHAWEDFLVAIDEIDNARDHADAEAKKYAAGKSNSLSSWVDRLTTENSHYKAAALRVASAFGYATSRFNWSVRYDLDSDFNEVKVDFR